MQLLYINQLLLDLPDNQLSFAANSNLWRTGRHVAAPTLILPYPGLTIPAFRETATGMMEVPPHMVDVEDPEGILHALLIPAGGGAVVQIRLLQSESYGSDQDFYLRAENYRKAPGGTALTWEDREYPWTFLRSRGRFAWLNPGKTINIGCRTENFLAEVRHLAPRAVDCLRTYTGSLIPEITLLPSQMK